MMITSATRSAWKLDVPIVEWNSAGLNKPCVARAKIFTLDNRLIAKETGKLATKDITAVQKILKKALPVT